METKKYVRIKKATVDGVWYADKIGQIFEVVRENSVAILTKCGGHHSVLREDVEVIVNNETRTEEVDEMKNVNQTTIDSASTVFEKVGDKYIGSKSRFGDILIGAPYSEAFVKAYASERKDVLVIPKTIEYTAFLRNEEMKKVATHGQAPIVNAQARRDEIVEQAKADVEELVFNGYDGEGFWGAEGNETYRKFSYSVEFLPDRKKRKVTALIQRTSDIDPRHVGRAKAAPSDCFNVHIGKAIALRRALGLTVPDEYLNTPQPTEVRVGDVVSNPPEWTGAVIADDGWPPLSGRCVRLKDARKYGLEIIDDSREEVSK